MILSGPETKQIMAENLSRLHAEAPGQLVPIYAAVNHQILVVVGLYVDLPIFPRFMLKPKMADQITRSHKPAKTLWWSPRTGPR